MVGRERRKGRRGRAGPAPGARGAPPPPPGGVETAVSALNAVLGDYLSRRANGLAIEMGLYAGGEPVLPGPRSLARARLGPVRKLCLLVHGLGTHEGIWSFPADRAISYGSLLQRDLGYVPCYLRYNTGLHISENGQALSGLLEALVGHHPGELEEIALIGHSMGGLVLRSACDVAARQGQAWLERVARIVYLGAPHLGAPLEKLGNAVAWVLRRIDDPHTRLVADVVDLRSSGIKDLRYANLAPGDWQGFDPDALLEDHRRAVPLAAGASHHLVVGTLTGSERHVLARLLGDAVVRVPSAAGRSQDLARCAAFPQENVRIFPGVGHRALAHHPAVYEQIKAWLGAPRACPGPSPRPARPRRRGRRGLLSPLLAATSAARSPRRRGRRDLVSPLKAAASGGGGDARRRRRGLEDLVQDAVDRGSAAVEQVHLAVARRPLLLLAHLPPLSVPARKALLLQEALIGGTYAAIRLVNRTAGALAGALMDAAEPGAPACQDQDEDPPAPPM